MRGPWYVPAAVAVVIAVPTFARAQQVRAGAELQANTHTTGTQRRPEVLVQPSGDFVVAWTGENPPLDSSSYGVFAQRHDVLGARVGAEFRVNTYTDSYQFRPVLAGDSRGNFVVAWSSYTQDGDYYGMFAQRFAADGSPRGAEFMVNSYTTGGQGASFYFVEHNHGAAMAPNGQFVVVWGSYNPGQDGDLSSVHGQRFAADGARLGGEFRVNSYTTGYQFGPSVAMAADSSFVVVWSSLDGGNYGVSGQRYDASGSPVGGEFQVNSYTTGAQQAAFVQMAGSGEFAVTFFSEGEVAVRRFAANGAPIGAQFAVNTYTTGEQYTYSFAMDRRGNFIVNWNGQGDPAAPDVGRRRFRSDGSAREPEGTVNLTTAGAQGEAAVASDDYGNAISVWEDVGRDGDGSGVFVQRFGGLRPSALAADAAGNGVIDPGETAALAPSWRNVNGAPQNFGGALSAITGPAGMTYTITDATAAYGTVPHDTVGPCTDCYGVQVSNPAPRPQTHIDASAVETITPDTQGQVKQWALHVGRSFTDVSPTSPFYRFIETLLHHSVTGGCTTTTYCPVANTTREQMAVFVLVGKEGVGYAPPPCSGTPVFADVPVSSPFCRWIEELSRRGVVSGCGGGNYCPAANVTREQMSVFVLRTLEPTLTPPACGTPMFNDVPASNPFCRWIEELARRSVVTGCGGGNYCPGLPVTREQMGVFISVTFGLTLYGL
jgi:hypothetical protein